MTDHTPQVTHQGIRQVNPSRKAGQINRLRRISHVVSRLNPREILKIPPTRSEHPLAFALRFRAADRTLKDADVAAARDAAVRAAADAFGAELRAL